PPIPLLQEILPAFIACQRPLLIFDAVDLGVLHPLGVEADQLLTEGAHRAGPPQPLDPGQDVGDAALEAGGEPSLTTAAVVEPGRAISRLAAATGAADHPPRSEGGLDRG